MSLGARRRSPFRRSLTPTSSALLLSLIHHLFAPSSLKTSFALVMFLTATEHLDLFIVRFLD